MPDNTTLLSLTSDIVASYLENNSASVDEVPGLIRSVYVALNNAEAPAEEAPSHTAATRAQIRKSITNDALISFEDGKSYKTLKRHLTTRGLTPAQYREKWGLPADYPMVAPSYSALRAERAKAAGLGVRMGKGAPKGRGRPRKS